MCSISVGAAWAESVHMHPHFSIAGKKWMWHRVGSVAVQEKKLHTKSFLCVFFFFFWPKESFFVTFEKHFFQQYAQCTNSPSLVHRSGAWKRHEWPQRFAKHCMRCLMSVRAPLSAAPLQALTEQLCCLSGCHWRVQSLRCLTCCLQSHVWWPLLSCGLLTLACLKRGSEKHPRSTKVKTHLAYHN